MSADDDAKAYYLKQIGVRTPLPASEQSASPEQAIPEPAQNPVPEAANSSVSPSASAEPEPASVTPTTSGLLSLEQLAKEASGCTACPLSEGRTQVVFGVGNPHADLVFIGEAPGRDEDLKGEPFVGRAGKLLDRMLAGLGLDRSSVYIMNVVKCRPPNNRDPRPEEIQACSRWFDAQLELLSPKVICLLGRVAAQSVLETDAPLGSLRGRWHQHHGMPVWVTYHPAYLLRSPQQKARAWQDLLRLNERYSSLSD